MPKAAPASNWPGAFHDCSGLDLRGLVSSFRPSCFHSREDAGEAGWDFVFLQGSGVGAAGAELLFNTDSISIRLAIENENETLKFRENLSLLAHSPGLRLRV